MDDIAYLIKEEIRGRDQYGNEILTQTPRMIYCQIQSVTRNEYYAAGTDDIKPELDLRITHRLDYEGENLVRYNGELYDVIRTFWSGDAVTLTLTKHVGITDASQ